MKEMSKMAFSESFVAGLETKSARFQREFYEIMDALYEYLDSEKEIFDFQSYLETQISYDKPGNQLFWRSGMCGGRPTQENKQEYIEDLQKTLFGLFQEDRDWNGENGVLTATHFIIAIRTPEGIIGDEEKAMLNFLFYLERPNNPPELTIIVTNKEAVCFEYMIAALK